MTSYELPEEPSGPLWGPTPDGETWIEYWKSSNNGLWYDARSSSGGRLTWYGLLAQGPLVDEDPRITLEDLADRVLGAAMNWRKVYQESTKGEDRAGARDDLNRAIDSYVAKLERR